MIGDSASGGSADCGVSSYDGKNFVGTRLTLRDADNSILDTAVVEGDGTLTDTNDPDLGAKKGCIWQLSLSGVGGSSAYQLEIQSPGQTAPETLTFSAE